MLLLSKKYDYGEAVIFFILGGETMKIMGKTIGKLFLVGLGIMLLTACSTNSTVEKKIKAPSDAEDLIGENYKSVISDLKDAGFTTIKTKKVEDLITGWLTKDGDIEKISINGISDFSKGDKFSRKAKISIRYHTFESKSEEASSTIEENDSEESEEWTSESSESSSLESSSTSDSTSSSTTNPSKKSQYDVAYEVKFKDYVIYYLFNEQAMTVTIFNTDDSMGIATYPYTGNFNDGIDFDQDGLLNHAHYHYENMDSTLIIADASGNENSATKTIVSIAENAMGK